VTTQNVALLVIDIQRGAFDGGRCPVIDAPERLVRNACALIDAARAGRRPIVFVQHCDREPGEPFEEGTRHWLLHESLVPARGETVVKKYASSAFEGTDLDGRLKGGDVDALVLCGLQSDFCVSSTARSAIELGYAVHLAKDAHSTWAFEGRTAAQIRDDVNDRLAEAGAVADETANLARMLRGRGKR
jgi:nicotinamidase-related amidase